MIVAMSCLAAAILASSVRPTTRGTISAARTPRIVITTMISISVKPRASRPRAPTGNCGERRGIIGVIKPPKQWEENLKIRAERLEVLGFSAAHAGGVGDIINRDWPSHPLET